jgi:hypothetical protein
MLIFTIGIMNLFLVHLVPGIIYMLLSIMYFPPANAFFKKKSGFHIPVAVKIILGILILWFTLGVSDLAEMYGL